MAHPKTYVGWLRYFSIGSLLSWRNLPYAAHDAWNSWADFWPSLRDLLICLALPITLPLAPLLALWVRVIQVWRAGRGKR